MGEFILRLPAMETGMKVARNNWIMDTNLWINATEQTAREAWNRVQPRSRIPMMISFVVCWGVLWLIIYAIPGLRPVIKELTKGELKESLPELLIMAAIALLAARMLVRLYVQFRRHRMPDGLIGVDTSVFTALGYEIVAEEDSGNYADTDVPYSMLSKPVKTILFCPTAQDRYIDVLTYPAGSVAGERGDAKAITMLISGTRIRIENGGTPIPIHSSSRRSASVNARTQYSSSGSYLLVQSDTGSAASESQGL